MTHRDTDGDRSRWALGLSCCSEIDAGQDIIEKAKNAKEDLLKRWTRPLVRGRPCNIDGLGDVGTTGLCGFGATGSELHPVGGNMEWDSMDKLVKSRYRVDEKPGKHEGR
uniref:Uncharacterized protein n=1 Tax=Parascaris equorum TaxID=6256 RepID=A0A914SIB6_PAREQ